MKRYRMWLLMVLVVGTAVTAQDHLVVIDKTPGPPAVRITPAEPTSRDEVFATYSIAVPNPGYGLECVDVRFIGSEIWLAIAVVPPPPDTAWIQVISEAEVTQLLGYLDPGTYTARAYIGDPDSHTCASTTFTVQDAGPPSPAVPPLSPTVPPMPEWVEQRRSQIPPGPDSGWMEQWRQEHAMPQPGNPPELPGFEVKNTSWSDVTDIKEGIAQLDITPDNPTPSDVVSVTICGWKGGNDLVVNHADLKVQGNEVRLDVHWHKRPAAVAAFHGARALDSVGQTQSAATVTRYELAPAYEGVPYEVTESLGTFDPGTYTLHVTNHGPVSGSASTTFTVSGPGPALGPVQESGRPWWWAAIRGDS